MGMIANYQPTSDSKLENFLCPDGVEELRENEDLEICNTDKIWDALRFLLIGESAGEPIKDDLVSEAIADQLNISGENIKKFISGIRSSRVEETTEALQKVDFGKYVDKFNMRNFVRSDIHPNIWGYEDEADEIRDDLGASFESLRKFYAKVAEQENVVLVSIC